MAEKYGAIFDAIQKRNVERHNAGDVSFADELYDAHAVVVDKTNKKHFFGLAEIKPNVEGFVKMGKIDFKAARKDIHEAGTDRFLVDLDFETTIVEAGLVIKGSFQQLFHKTGDQWKVVYECYEMH